MGGIEGILEMRNDFYSKPLKVNSLKFGYEHPHTLESCLNLIDLYGTWGKPEKAEQWRARLPDKSAAVE